MIEGRQGFIKSHLIEAYDTFQVSPEKQIKMKCTALINDNLKIIPRKNHPLQRQINRIKLHEMTGPSQ